VRLAAEAQLRNGGNSAVGNAFEGDIGFDYMGLSMDFVGGKITDAPSVSTTLTTGQVNTILGTQTGASITGYAVPCSLGCLSATVSDNTVFAVAARYTIGPWKLYGGYEHIQYANPDSPLAAGAFTYGGYNLGIVNNNFYVSDKNLNVFWVGVKYAVLPTLDIAGAYYGQRAGYFTQGAGPGAGVTALNPTGALAGAAQAAACAANSASFAGCAGGTDMVSLAIDWRFARHVDLYAGVAWEQKFGGFVNGYMLSTANGTATTTGCNAGVPPCTLATRVSNFDPGIGLRYQF